MSTLGQEDSDPEEKLLAQTLESYRRQGDLPTDLQGRLDKLRAACAAKQFLQDVRDFVAAPRRPMADLGAPGR